MLLGDDETDYYRGTLKAQPTAAKGTSHDRSEGDR
jgi:hypothetical protein